MMNFTDPRAGECYKSNFVEVEGQSREKRQVHALMAVHEFISITQGPDSSGVHETVWHLLLPRLRPELRRWYHRSDSGRHAGAVALRSHLSTFLRELL